MDRIYDVILKNIEQLYGFNEEQKEIAQYGLQAFLEMGSNFLIAVMISAWKMGRENIISESRR